MQRNQSPPRTAIRPDCRFARLCLGALCLGALCLGGLALTTASAAVAAELDELARRASWELPTPDEVRSRLDKFLETAGDPVARELSLQAWDEGASTVAQPLDRLVAALAAVDERAAAIQSACTLTEPTALPPRFEWLFEQSANSLPAANLRLLYGRWLAQRSYYDEALEYLAGVELNEVVDPAALLFYRSVAHHRLLNKQACLSGLNRLLENEELIPSRFRVLAGLMVADLRPLEEDSLDEVARLMEDVQRRLQFGRAGARVRQQEDDVIAKLDKMIEAAEQQQQQQQAGGGAGQGSQANTPANQSGNFQQRGPGDVDQRPIGDKSGWGNLPPKERQQALQQISKDLPSHFREVIEEYFRKLAKESER